VLAALKAGSSIPPHQTEGRISIHTLQGRIQVTGRRTHVQLACGRIARSGPGAPA
jgi:hypothetical protein